MATIKVTWHPDAMDKALAWALMDDHDNITVEQARIRLNKIANDLLFGDALPCAIDVMRAIGADD